MNFLALAALWLLSVTGLCSRSAWAQSGYTFIPTPGLPCFGIHVARTGQAIYCTINSPGSVMAYQLSFDGSTQNYSLSPVLATLQPGYLLTVDVHGNLYSYVEADSGVLLVKFNSSGQLLPFTGFSTFAVGELDGAPLLNCQPLGFACDSTGELLYFSASSSSSYSLFQLDSESGAVLATVSTPPTSGLAFDWSSGVLYLNTLSSSIVSYAAATLTLLAVLPAPPIYESPSLGLDGFGHLYYFSVPDAFTLSQVDLNGTLVQQVAMLPFSGGGGIYGMLDIDQYGTYYSPGFEQVHGLVIYTGFTQNPSAGAVVEYIAMPSPPFWMAVSVDGTMYVVDNSLSTTVWTLAANGSVLATWDLSAGYHSGMARSADDVFVVNWSDGYVAEMQLSGTVVKTFSTESPSLNEPQGLAVDELGNVFVVDQANGRVVEFVTDGSQRQFSGLSNPIGLAIDGSGYSFFVAESGYPCVTQIRVSDGTVLQRFTSADFSTALRGVAVDSGGSVYVVDQGNNRVAQFLPDGFLSNYFYTSNPAMSGACGLAVSDGNLYACDQGNSRIIIWQGVGPQPSSSLLSSSSSSSAQVPAATSSSSTSAPAASVTSSQSLTSMASSLGTAGSTQAFPTTSSSSAGSASLTPAPSSTAAAKITGDPQFVGLHGQSYQVHGLDGAVYALSSTRDCQVNALFTFLSHGRCPVMASGQPDSSCWSHPGSYMGAVTVQQRAVDGSMHRLAVHSGSHSAGFASVLLNNRSLSVGDKFADGVFYIAVLSSHRAEVGTDELSFVFSNSDGFLNMQVAPLLPLKQMTAHGLLGQTHRLLSGSRAIEGDVDDYTVQGGDDKDGALWSHRFLYTRFEL